MNANVCESQNTTVVGELYVNFNPFFVKDWYLYKPDRRYLPAGAEDASHQQKCLIRSVFVTHVSYAALVSPQCKVYAFTRAPNENKCGILLLGV